MSIDMFATRTMLQAIEQMAEPRTFLRDTFFPGREVSTTEYVDIDVYKGKRRMAPFVQPMAQGKVIDGTGFTTKTFKPPYVKPKKPYSGADILKRKSGDTIYQGNSSPAQRAQVQLGKDLIELQDGIVRREEWMASKALTTGKIAVVGEGVSAEIDFLMAAAHIITLTGTALWSDAANSDPIDNLRTWSRLCSQDSGEVSDVAVFGASVMTSFLKNTNVKNLLDKTKITLGQIDPKTLPNGVTYWGSIEGRDIYTYDEWYVDDTDGLEYPMVPVDKVILGSTRTRNAKHYGAIQDLKATAAVPYFPKSWEEEDPSVRWVMLQSAPLVALHEPDAFIAAKVV